MRILGHGSPSLSASPAGAPHTVLVDDELSTYALAGGSGELVRSGADGPLAMLRKTMRELVLHLRETNASTDASVRSAVALVRGAVQQCCYTLSREGSAMAGVDPWLYLIVIIEERAVVGYFGAAQIFLLRDGRLHRLSRTAPDAKESARGAQPASPPVNIFHFELLPGDRLVGGARALGELFEDAAPYVRALGSADLPAVITERVLFIARTQGAELSDAAILTVTVDGKPDRAEADELRRAEVSLRADSLKSIFLFRDVDMAELLEVADRSILIVAREGEVIFREGDRGDAMYLIVEGRCVLTKVRTHVANLDAGAHFGEMSLLTSEPRSGTVTASERSKLLRITRDDFQDILQASPATGVKLLSALGVELSRRLAAANNQHI